MESLTLASVRELQARTAAGANRAMLELIRRHRRRFRTITADNGTGFHCK